MPFFSVVISVYNKEKHLKTTLDSVLAQTFDDFEIIIINDGSTDESLNIINTFDDKRLRIISQDNQGASAARNLGITTATSNYIALLDGDDFWDISYLETIYKTIQSYPEESVFATAIAQHYKHKFVPVNYSFKTEDVTILNYFKNSIKYTILTSSSIVFKNDIIETTGLFDISIKSGQDTDLWIRIGLHYPIVFIPEILAFYVYNNESLSNTTYDIKSKPKYDKYEAYESTNKDLKKVLDMHRYSMSILSKLYDEHDSFKYYKSHLSFSNLNLKQKILIQSPKWLLWLLLKIKSFKGEKLYYKPL